MQGIDLDRRRRTSLHQRSSVQVVVGALAIAAIVLAFFSNPAEAPTETVPGAPAQPTSASAAIVPIPTSTVAPPSKSPASPAAAPATEAAAPASETSQESQSQGTEERIHEVTSGDTLGLIADRYYGDSSQFEKIFEANRDVLDTPDSLQVGQKLKIPE